MWRQIKKKRHVFESFSLCGSQLHKKWFIWSYDFSDLEDAFDLLDLDKDGELSRAEICALLRTIKVEPNFKELNVIFDEIHAKDGKIKKSEFLEYMKSPPIYGITINELEKEFQEHDTDNDGQINVEELGQILSTTAGISDQKVINYVFALADKNETGLINKEQFFDIIRS